VYSNTYNIHAFGLEKLHPFDASKYRRVYQKLLDTKVIDESVMKVLKPGVPTREFLQGVMTWYYLFSLNYSIPVCKILELPVCFLPGWVIRMRVLEPMMSQTLGSVEAAVIAR
jgi:histone deacetylase 11